MRVDDDPFVRQLIAAGDLSEEYVQDQRQRRQVPVEVNVLVVGGRDKAGQVYQLPAAAAAGHAELGHRLPERRRCASSASDWTSCAPCSTRPTRRPTSWLPRPYASMAAAQGDPGQAQRYLQDAGRELARLLSRDPVRLSGILQRMH